MCNTVVDVILAAHNGEKYIKEQIESILGQTHSALKLIVTDDGSKDSTVDIVKSIAAMDTRVSLHICPDSTGVVSNFNYGLQFSNADYIFFSDQDDVWEDTKIEVMLSKMRETEMVNGAVAPCLGFSNLHVVDEHLQTIHSDFYRFSQLTPENNLNINYLLWRSSVYGCTTVMNRVLFNSAGKVPARIAMHDHWYAFQAALHGKIFYVPQALIQYRQHSANVVGAHQRGLLARIKRFSKTLDGIKRSVVSARLMYLMYHHKDENSPLSLTEKLSFLKNNILPYYKERLAYNMIFSILWLTHG